MIEFAKKINKYSLFLLVFSVTYEYWDPFKLVGSVSVTYMASVIYIISWVPLAKTHLQLVPLKKYLLPLLLFTIIGIFSTALNSGYAKGLADLYDYRVVLLIILMLLIANHLYNDRSLNTKILNIYVGSVVLMFILVMLGIGTEYKGGRLMFFGENPNKIGIKSTIAFLIVAARLLENKFSVTRLIVGIVLIFPLLNLVILSASRGALISVFLGMAVLVLYMKISIWKKLLSLLAGIAFSVLFFNYIMQSNEAFKNRIVRTIETGDTGRNALWAASFEIIADNPLLGVGHAGALPVMYKYSGRHMDPHNTFLYVLMITGIIGFIFFMTFVFRLGKNLYKKFKVSGHVLFLVIFIVILFNMSKAGGGIGSIFFWFFFSILIGATFMLEEDQQYVSENNSE